MTFTRARLLADSAPLRQGDVTRAPGRHRSSAARSAAPDRCRGGPQPLGAALLVSAAAALAALTGHAAPALTTVGPLRRAGWPRLAGVGAPGGIALTFDDGPDPDGTPAVLAALETLNWQATFFLLGSQVNRYPDVAQSVVAAGHEIAVHGQQHRNHLLRSPADVRRDVLGAAQLIEAVTGVRPRWFRPPYGVLTAGSLLAARDAALTPVLWTAWGRDWVPRTPAAITARIVRDLRDGGTVLLHDSDCTSVVGSWRATARCLPLLAEHLQIRGWDVRTLSQHMAA